MTRTHIGVDLSKDWLDVFDPRSGHARVANIEAPIRAWLGTLGPEDVIVFEATSLCDGLILRLASACGQPFHRLNPLHGWHFGQSLNLPKTDRVDAQMLARIGTERALEPSPAFAPERAELAELVGRRDQLKRMQTQERNRLGKTFSATVRADIRAALAALDRRVRKVEAAIGDFVSRHPDIDHGLRLLQSIPSIGRITGLTLLAAMPELGRTDRRAIASLGGLAPRARESGKWRGRRFLGNGRRQVRRALYMAALSAIRHGQLCPGLVARMREAGKPGKVVAIAVARKLLTIANAVLRDQTPYATNA